MTAWNRKNISTSCFVASKEALGWLRDYLSDTLGYARENAAFRLQQGENWGGWFEEQDWRGWQEHMANLTGRVEALLALPGDQLDLLALPQPEQCQEQEEGEQTMEEQENPSVPLARITLTLSNGDQQELALPLQAAEILRHSTAYYLAYGQATVEFTTPDPQLNRGLDQCMQAAEVSLQELNALALLLSRMDEQRLGLLSENLPSEPCGCAELTRRVIYFGKYYLNQEGAPDPQATPLEKYDATWDGNRLTEGAGREFRQELENQRLTSGQLFAKVIERAKENGDLARTEPICDYILPDSHEGGKLCSYEFDFVPIVNFGGSEGVYIDCGLRGKFDESGRNRINAGTIKTLHNDLAACKAMGELCGALLYHESAYVNENLPLFDSAEAIERMLSRELRLEQVMEAPLQEMGGMEIG